MRKELVSIVIPSLKKAEEIEWLRDVKKQTFNNYEIIVDNSKGISKARNNALKKAMGSIIAFADDDIIPDENWLENIVKNIDGEYGIVGKIIPITNNIFNKIPEHYNQGDESHYTIFGAGCNMAFRKEIFAEIGNFDDTILWGHDESDLIHRFTKRYKLKYCPDVVVYHNYAKNLTHYLKKRWFFGKCDLYYWEKTGRYPLSSYTTGKKMEQKKQTLSFHDKIKINTIKKVGWIFEGIGILQSVVK